MTEYFNGVWRGMDGKPLPDRHQNTINGGHSKDTVRDRQSDLINYMARYWTEPKPDEH